MTSSPRLSRTSAVLAVVAALMLASGTGAVAGALVTSKQIKDNTIQSRDIRDRGVQGRDVASDAITGREVKNGTVGVADLDASTRALTVGTVYNWDFSHTADGRTGVNESAGNTVPLGFSNDSVPAYSRIEGVAITGSVPGCPNWQIFIYLSRDLDEMPEVASRFNGGAHGRFGISPTGAQPARLALHASCYNRDSGTYVELPTFSGRVTFIVTAQKTTPAVAFE